MNIGELANFRFGINAGTSTATNSVDPMVNVNRTITGAGNSHCFSDSSTFSKDASTAYCSYDARMLFSGSNAYDHYAAFQSSASYASYTGTITNHYGLYSGATLHASTTITNYYAIYCSSPTSGTVTNKYSIFAESSAGNAVLRGTLLEIGNSDANGTSSSVKIVGKSAGGTALYGQWVIKTDGYFSLNTQAVTDAIKFDTATGDAILLRKLLVPNIGTGTGTYPVKYLGATGELLADTSSRLVKTNIEEVPYGLKELLLLKPRKYDLIRENGRTELGFVADEVADIIPELVPLDKKSRYTGNLEDTELIPSFVYYDRMSSVIVKAIQDQQAMIEELKAEVAALKAK